MARTKVININGEQQLCVNIAKIVGFAGANLKEDVMLIQALFNYIATGLYPGAVGLGGDYKIPEITGEMDADTYSAIGEFQLRNARQLIGKFDGRIHPASYQNRVLKDIRKPVMCMTLLHIMATDAAVMQSDYHYRDGLIRLKPELAQYLDQFD